MNNIVFCGIIILEFIINLQGVASMVQRLYSKCNMCDKITMIKYQVGYDSFPIIYGCPNCLTEIHGKSIHNDEKLTVSFEFDNATTVTSKEGKAIFKGIQGNPAPAPISTKVELFKSTLLAIVKES